MEVVASKIQRVQMMIKVLVQLVDFVLLYFPDSSDPDFQWLFYNKFKE